MTQTTTKTQATLDETLACLERQLARIRAKAAAGDTAGAARDLENVKLIVNHGITLAQAPTCPGCSGAGTPEQTYPCGGQTYTCQRCGGLYGVNVSKAEVARLVGTTWATDPAATSRERYYDFGLLGGGRTHGFFDPMTRTITQTG